MQRPMKCIKRRKYLTKLEIEQSMSMTEKIYFNRILTSHHKTFSEYSILTVNVYKPSETGCPPNLILTVYSPASFTL